jgi:asparagine synthase (glutamine-hydrolysing)
MCGIAGIFNLDGRPVKRSVIDGMIRSLTHRGPDSTGIWLNGPVGFGHTRLAIRDLSERGQQPMTTGNAGSTVTYNGEIYNDSELRESLKTDFACEFATTCDTEVIGPAYRHWGTRAFSTFKGMFAIGLWDEQRRHLVLARDPIGIKPLYYRIDQEAITFASEIKALLSCSDTMPTLVPEALHSFLGQGYPGPECSLAEGIKPLPPGCFLVADATGIRVERYWVPSRTGEITAIDEALEQFDSLWGTVVRDHLLSDVPVGLLLSAGIDSSLVGAALARGNGRVSTFTAGFESGDYDESESAARIAKHFSLPHETLMLETLDLGRRFISVVEHYDGQCADSSGLAFHAICEAAATRQKVVLTGDGADEFFAGYDTYSASRIANWLGPFIPSRLADFASELLRRDPGGRLRVSRSEKLARWLGGIAVAPDCPHPQWRRYGAPRDLNRLYSDRMREAVSWRDALSEYTEAVPKTGGTLVDRCLLADQAYYLPGDLLMKSDAMSMAHSLEVRVPFLDVRMMEFASRLHVSLLSPLLGPNKFVLRQAAARWGVPGSITKLPKRGFNIPVAALLRTSLKEIGEFLLGREADVFSPYLRPDTVRAVWNEHQECHANHGYLLWSLLTLAVWRAGPRAVRNRMFPVG